MSLLKRVPPPPKTLSERAVAEWRRLAPLTVRMGTLSDVDLPALALLCEVQATIAEASDILRRDGMTATTAAGGHKPHPGVRILESARNQAAGLLREFGLTPKSRRSVTVKYSWEHGNDMDGDDDDE